MITHDKQAVGVLLRLLVVFCVHVVEPEFLVRFPGAFVVCNLQLGVRLRGTQTLRTDTDISGVVILW